MKIIDKYIYLKSHNKRQEVDKLPARTWANQRKRLLLMLDVTGHDSNDSTSAVFAKFGLALQLSELQGTIWPLWQGQGRSDVRMLVLTRSCANFARFQDEFGMSLACCLWILPGL